MRWGEAGRTRGQVRVYVELGNCGGGLLVLRGQGTPQRLLSAEGHVDCTWFGSKHLASGRIIPHKIQGLWVALGSACCVGHSL